MSFEVANPLHKQGRLAQFVTDEPSYSANLLANRLKKAATQLPRSGPEAIFVMLPSPWIAIDTFAEDTRRAVASIFRNYSRTNAIFFHWEEWSAGPAHARFPKVHSAISDTPKVAVHGIERLLEASPHPPPGNQLLVKPKRSRLRKNCRLNTRRRYHHGPNSLTDFCKAKGDAYASASIHASRAHSDSVGAHA
jgi:hypothetical protein